MVATVSPERTFPVTVAEFEPQRRMVWQGGLPLGLFRGVRTFTLTESAPGTTTFTMREVFSGPLLGQLSDAARDVRAEALASLGELRRFGLIDTGAERRLAKEWVDRLRIRTPGIDTLCLNLSGGNQQKVVLAKWLNARSKILILDHPTRGLDVGAKEEVYELVRAVTAEGMAVVLTSDTLEETIGLSHTLLVMRDGEITHRADASPGHKPEQVELIEHMV